MSESENGNKSINEGLIKHEDDEPDEWDKRIFSTGCAGEIWKTDPVELRINDMAVEQTKMNDCYFEKKDWRACAGEMQAFRACWKINGNDQRTSTKDA